MSNKPIFSIQAILSNDLVTLLPLERSHFEELYAAASDKVTWAQHPNPLRYQKEVFQNYFQGAIESQGAFVVVEKSSSKIIGSIRFYDYESNTNSIFIGYTFLQYKYWGGRYNPSIKKLLLDYIFTHVQEVHFHVGANNLRSQKAMERLGAEKGKEIEIAYFGEAAQVNIEYVIKKERWQD
jgi:N-acetyltransferase